MTCGLCKKNNITVGMSMLLRDRNGNMDVQLCQSCLKKLKNGVRNTKPMKVEIYEDKTK